MPYTGGYPAASDWKVVRGRYDFAVDGGAIGATNMTPAGAIPANAIILGGFIEVDTLLTSGGAATMAVSVEGAGDIFAAITVAGAPWSTTGRKSIIPAFTGATAIKTTAARAMVATIAALTVTAGAFDVVLFYINLPD